MNEHDESSETIEEVQLIIECPRCKRTIKTLLVKGLCEACIEADYIGWDCNFVD